MLRQFMKEVEKEPFDVDEFVETLAWKTLVASSNKNTDTEYFDSIVLHNTFTQTIKELQTLQERQKEKCERLEASCKEEEAKDFHKIAHLQERNKITKVLFHDLDERINFVATKVIHLGDQLESVNSPRSRTVQALKLMMYFEAFHNGDPHFDDVFTNKARINEAADIIQKLYSIAFELPENKFGETKRRINAQYNEMERSLIVEFEKAHEANEISRMKEIADSILYFKGYGQCIDAFIEHSQKDSFTGSQPFSEIIPLCEKYYIIMKRIFSYPQQVMAKFVLNIYHLKLQAYISSKLADETDSEKYLKNLYELYSNTLKLSEKMSKFDMGNDKTYLNKLTKTVFQKYLDSYISIESKHLLDKFAKILHKYYESKNHQKKQIPTGGFQDLRRDLQAVIGARTNINIAQIEDYGGETFISEEVAISMLQESKMALQRCQLLSHPSQLATDVKFIAEILLHSLMIQHVQYALELGLQSVPIPETKNYPQIYFFDVVRQTNAVVLLLEKLYNDSVIPLLISSPKYEHCIDQKRRFLELIEIKLNNGLDRSVNAIVGWVKIYLQNEQKKTDFKPETEDLDTLPSSACLAVVQYVSKMVENIRERLDDRNAKAVLYTLGTRFHRVIYEHLQQYQYNTAGAMCAICDVNEYRKCMKDLRIPFVDKLFDTLHALCNLLLVKPENLKQVCTGGQLEGLQRSILLNFIQLRSDYKTQKLANSLKGLSS